MSESKTNEATITPNELAEFLGANPKQLRAMMRTMTTNRAGKGGAWALSQADAHRIALAWIDKRSIRATAPQFIDPANESD